MIEDRKQIYEDIKLLGAEVDLRQKNFDNLKTVASKYEAVKEAQLVELKDGNVKDIEDIELRKRKYQIIKYQNYLNEETKHMLWVLLVLLIICCFLILGNLIKLPGFSQSNIFTVIFIILGIYEV